jgi:hypothetical protein
MLEVMQSLTQHVPDRPCYMIQVLTERYNCYKRESEVDQGLDLESLAKFLIEGFAFR